MYLFYNARIRTLDEQQPSVTAIAVEERAGYQGKVIALGDDTQLLKEFGDKAEKVDLTGKVVIPGLIDAHIHLRHYAQALQKVDCETPTQDECLARVAERAGNTPAGEWVLGHGWNHNEWPQGFGDAALLDAAAPKNPVYLTAKSLHAGWANHAALQQAGIAARTSDPPGGQIQRDERGQPTGILFESAMALVAEVVPEISPARLVEALREAQTRLWQLGLTGVHDFDRRACFVALQQLHAGCALGLRVTKSIPVELVSEAVALGLRTGFGDDLLRIGSVKAFADGALGPRTAAMLQPYEGEGTGKEDRGMLMIDGEELFEIGRQAVPNGLSLAVHAIGDRANHEVLNAYRQLRHLEREQWERDGSKPGEPLRHRIEHVQLIHPDDAPLLAELDVIASMQPIHATSDYPMADRHWGARSENAYAWRTLDAFGTRMAFGSDAPVESPNPFWGLHAAVTRRRANGDPGPEGWYPQQRLSAEEALRGFTTGAAYAAGLEDRLGKLAPGYLADLLVLDEDPLLCDAERIKDLVPLGTMMGGTWVFRAFD